MGLSFEEAYRILELPRGSSQDEIRASYKRLALKWHPDKHGNSTEATEKFQEVSSAYKRLTSTDDEADIVMTPADMFDLFAHIFFANGMFGCMHRHDSDYDDEFTDDDSEEDEFLGGIANRLRRKYERYEKSAEKRTSAHNLSEAEAMRNAEELIQEEEKERKRAEKRRAKKKRNKERKKQKDKEKEKETRKDGKENRQDTVGGGDIQNNSISKNSTEKKNNNNLSNDTNNSKKSSSKKNGLREKTSNEQNPQTSKKEPGQNKSRHDEDSDSHTEEPDWDTSSAFFAHAAGQPVPGQSVSKSSPNSNTNDIQVTSAPTQKQPECTDNRNGSLPTPGSKSDHVDPLVIKSRQVAVRGNEMANAGNYQAAVELFTEAIELDSRDFRFFGNRSYCFDRMGQYEKALQDANLAITLAPDWPKGYFRRGRALAGLKLFSDAESSFSQVLKLDKHCEDAMFELARVRVQQLEEMGFPFAESEAAIQAYGTVQAALEALLAGKVKVTVTEEIYMSDGETDSPSSKNRISENTGQCQALWVGNVDPEQVNEKHLVQLFSRCAKVDNVRLLPKRFCAFVNFVTPEGAAAALEKMQGYEIGGQNLLLRYPNNTGAPGTENAPLRKPVTPTSVVSQPSYSQPRLPSTQASKVTGPVNGDECYFWRTSGCAFGDKCKYNHIPAHKAVDLRKVEAKYGGRLRLQNPNTKS